ncbi:MAG: NADH-quinone oxidoreductase subunit L [Candidatus Hydrogenedentes bacterium]|nr:NADH-quinone oxidoreductase subunit L [Candidatus Hydrogenedentota bacterium]
MLMELWVVPALPLAGFCVLALVGKRLSRWLVAGIGAGSVGLAMVGAIYFSHDFMAFEPTGHLYRESLWTWLNVGGFSPDIGLYLDPLSVVMMLVVTIVGFLIHVYSIQYMAGDEAYSRFFAYMNLFVSSMLILVLADDLLILYLGWEGVGLCSYLLIGFWYQSAANARAAIKAFVVTRVGDTAMAIGLFLLFTQLGTLDIQEVLVRAVRQWPVGSATAIAAAGLLLAGAVGKSAQLPLQVWLPDAMAGPTPVSALIHAATMVTAGVYLIARMHDLFIIAPPVQTAVAVIGAATLVLAGCSAMTQFDIKRVLAYSTISQVGYMFLALGVHAWSAALFHFMTHAFFKSLLFMGAGAVIISMHHEQNMFKMGGLRKQLPFTFWTFLIGACSLASLPLVTSGFYSKGLILWSVWATGHPVLWGAALLGEFITSVYTFRMVFLTFFGEPKGEVSARPGPIILGPLVILAFFSTVAGCVHIPRPLGHFRLFARLVEQALPVPPMQPLPIATEVVFQLLMQGSVLLGVAFAYVLFLRRNDLVAAWTARPAGNALHRFWFSGWGFDWVYTTLLAKPYVWFAHASRDDAFEWIYRGIGAINRGLHEQLSRTQTGLVRWYAVGIVIGAVLLLGLVVFL